MLGHFCQISIGCFASNRYYSNSCMQKKEVKYISTGQCSELKADSECHKCFVKSGKGGV